MAMTTEELLPESNTTIDFRAPPPSPVASGRRSSFNNEDVLSEFLENSLRVPDLSLPDRIFPRQKAIQNPPKLDFERMSSLGCESLAKFIELVSRTGCFEVVNHGVSPDLIKSVLAAGAGIFRISLEKRKIVTRSLERPHGFEEFHGEDQEKAIGEEFVWCRDESLKMDMEGIWPVGYSNFSEKMEKLLKALGNMADEILVFLKGNASTSETTWEEPRRDQEFGPICYLHRHHINGQVANGGDQPASSLRYDVIRMLVRGSEFPHCLCLHVCNGSQEFHVYSKKGWVSFIPDEGTLVITIGDQLQEWSRGQYKHVTGRPIFKEAAEEACMSMAVLYSPPPAITNGVEANTRKIISVSQQIIFVIAFTVFYRIILYTFKFFL